MDYFPARNKRIGKNRKFSPLKYAFDLGGKCAKLSHDVKNLHSLRFIYLLNNGLWLLENKCSLLKSDLK